MTRSRPKATNGLSRVMSEAVRWMSSSCVTSLHCRYRQLARIRDLHTPVEEETELWPGDELHDERWPDCTMEVCIGHIETIQVCSECGYEHDGDRLVFRAWPCPALRAAGGAR